MFYYNILIICKIRCVRNIDSKKSGLKEKETEKADIT